MRKTEKRATSSQSLVQSILLDIKKANPGISEQDVVSIFQHGIAETIPLVVRRIRLRPVLSIWDRKYREFLYLRSSKSVRGRMDEQGEDPESVVRIYQSYLMMMETNVHDSPITGSYGNFQSGLAGQTSYQIRDVMPALTSAFAPAVKEKPRATDTGGQNLISQPELTRSQQPSRIDESGQFNIDPELYDVRDISMAQGRFFSIIEREARTLNAKFGKRFTQWLSKRPSLREDKSSYLLSIQPPQNASLDEAHTYRQTLEKGIVQRLKIIAEVLKEPEKTEFAGLIGKLHVIIELKIGKDLESTEYWNTNQERMRRWLLKKVREKIESKALLNLDDFALLRKYLSTADRKRQEQQLMLLRKDIKTRRQIFGYDCVKELYRDEELLQSSIRLHRPNPNSLSQLNQEAMRAICLSEYRRIRRSSGSEFISGNITYEEYRSRITRSRKLAYDLWSED